MKQCRRPPTSLLTYAKEDPANVLFNKGIRDAGSTVDFRILFEILRFGNFDNLEKFGKFGKFWTIWKILDNFGRFGKFWKI